MFLKKIEIYAEEITEAIPKLAGIIHSSHPVKISFELPLYLCLANVNEKLVLSGQGADELFGGYARYVDMNQEELKVSLKRDTEALITNDIKMDYRIAELFKKTLKTPYLHEGEPPTYTFDTSVHIAAGLSIKDVTCPTHKVNISYDGPDTAKVVLDDSEKQGGNRDFILKYRLAGGKIETGLLLFEGEKENFFLLMLQPPKRVKADQIPKREYVFIVDVSG